MSDDTKRLLSYLRDRERCPTAQLEAALNLSEACLVLAATDAQLFDRRSDAICLTPAGRRAAAQL